MLKTDKYDISLSICRITAMFFIVLCHLLPKIGFGVLGTVFDVGVPMFLLLSGYLYGGRWGGGTNKWRFLAASWIKICIPMYLWLAAIVYMYCLDKDFSVLKSIPVFLLNLQGSNWVADFVNVPVISDMGILWFFTVIMLCYAMHPVMARLAVKVEKKLWFLLPLFVVVLAAGFVGIHLNYFYIYLLGFIAGRRSLEVMKGNQIFFIGFLAIVLQMVRIAARYFIDGSFLYQHVVVFIAHTGLAASLMLIIRYFVKKNQFYRFLKKHIGQVIYMDRLSVYVYIVHYSFLKGILATDKITGNAFVWIPTFLLMTFVTAMALKTLSESLIKKCNHFS